MNIYVSGLSFSVKDAGLESLFAEFGEVSSAKVITDRATGRSRGFGFVEMDNDAEATKAIEALNGAEHEGRTISVNIAKEKTERSPSDRRDRY